MESFLTPIREQFFETQIKRSRFIATFVHVENREQAKSFVAAQRQRYPDANHHCWAMIAGAPDDVFLIDQSDDGEPRGSAGKPMLNVLSHSGLGQTIVVVTRFFGGTKLGVGGLVRAYSQAVSGGVAALDTRKVLVSRSLVIVLPYSLVGKFEYWIKGSDCELVEKSFGTDVELTVLVPPVQHRQLADFVRQLSDGSIEIPLPD